MVSATRSAISGMRAASRMVDAAASNIANARTSSRPEDAVVEPSGSGRRSGGERDGPQSEGYTAVQVSQESQAGGGVGSG